MVKAKVVLSGNTWVIVNESNQVIMKSNNSEELESFLDSKTLPLLMIPKQDCM